MLEQVVVVGYGTQKKSDLTGSVAVVDAEALKQTSNSNISTMLEGKVSGVQSHLRRTARRRSYRPHPWCRIFR